MVSSEGFTSKRLIITIRGIVQGVGFRPFVYREAKRFGIAGYVVNTSEGVVIDAQGENLAPFLETLRDKSPERSRIDTMHVEAAVEHNAIGFEIRESAQGSIEAAIPLDTALCLSCHQEMDDPSDRRYRYPFINCTDCGPRYTIMQIPPYDRVRTSMKHFQMCPECRQEYEDPYSRRYHAEPISCPACGPVIILRDPFGAELETDDPIEAAAQLLREGKIIALKGLGGFHLMCDATDEAAVERLRERKRRPSKPLAVMFSEMEQMEQYVCLNDVERRLIEGALKPIVIVDAAKNSSLAKGIAPGIGRIGVFLPYTPLHRLIFEKVSFPLVATSANLSEEPILIRYEEIVSKLGNVVDAILDHNRPIVNALDDSVVQVAEGKTVLLRMGRGYAPWTRTLETPNLEPLMAVGAHQKSSVALANGKTLVLGGHIGDLGSLVADEYFERTVQTFKRFYDCEPKRLISDLHPEYSSTRFAAAQRGEHDRIQHHYAHILACMAEFDLGERVLGFAFDGTGLGEGSVLWGGEVMLADAHGYERVGSFNPIRLLGSDKAIREPRRIGLSLLFESYSLDEVLALDIPVRRSFMDHEIRQMHHMWVKGLNSPQSSSLGRLFDGVASLGGFIQKLDYEGQSGMIMEGYVDPVENTPFAFTLQEGIIDLGEAIRQMVGIVSSSSIDEAEQKRLIASRFIVTIVAVIRSYASQYPELPIVVGGGVFQNRALMSHLYRAFAGERFYAQQSTPINDGSIALGQAWWGIHNGPNRD
ncbi:MAG: carbamoyltransferase HypF [Sulfuricurvum sp.]